MSAEEARVVRRLTRAAVVGGVALGLLATLWGGLPLLSAAWLGVLVVTLPLVSRSQLVLLGDFVPPRRVMYTGTAATLVVMGATSLALILWEGVPGDLPLLMPPPLPILLVEALGVTTVALAAMFVARWVERRLGLKETPLLRSLLPQSTGDRWAFAGLSLAAGTGEELAYRGFAMFWLASLMGSPAAGALLAAVAFGALHAYQGVLGMVRAGALGLILAWSVFRTGSLWPAMVAHATLDLLVGLVLTRFFVDEHQHPTL